MIKNRPLYTPLAGVPSSKVELIFDVRFNYVIHRYTSVEIEKNTTAHIFGSNLLRFISDSFSLHNLKKERYAAHTRSIRAAFRQLAVRRA